MKDYLFKSWYMVFDLKATFKEKYEVKIGNFVNIFLKIKLSA